MKSIFNKMTDLQKRLIGGFSGFFIIMGAILWNGWSFFILFLFIMLLTLREFYQLAQKAGYKPMSFYGIFAGLSIYTLTFLISKNLLSSDYYILLYPLLSIFFVLRLYQKKAAKNAFADIALSFLGIFQVALPFSLLHLVVFQEGIYNYRIILSILFLIWIHDIGAYFAGKYFGKHQLFKSISPKKTWEGSIAGAISAFIMVFILSNSYTGIYPETWLVVAVIIIVAGTYGDLVESLYKRDVKIKDTSQAILGHGGFLDRFDGLLLATPFIVAFLKFF